MMLTRCPACQTVFRITPEQLKARQGRVRCGECRHVFNALDTLLDEAGPLQPPAETPAAPAPLLESPPTNGLPGAEGTVAPESARSAAEGPPEIEEPAGLAPTMPPPVQESPPPPEEAVFAEPGPPAPSEFAEEPAPLSVRETVAGTEVPAEPPPGPNAPVSSPDSEVAAQEPPPREVPASQGGFDPDAAPFLAEPAPIRRRLWPWVIGTLLALLVLVAQATYHFRVELAVIAPELRPLLAQACDALGCDLPLPRQSALLGIESSDLHPDPERKSRLLLSATLRNRAPFAQALPHLEVTLTDTADQAVVRKVLPPETYLPARQAAEGIPPNGDLPVSLSIDTDAVAAAGYRLYIFYP